jgi:hypothetical protein
VNRPFIRLSLLLGLSAIASSGAAQTDVEAAASNGHRHAAHFLAHDVATGLADGYQIVIADIDGDRDVDLLPVASGLSELAWFEFPAWQRHVITGDLTRPENVDAYDIDRDGIPEIGMVSGFSQSPSRSAGIVTILTHAGDPRGPWSAREIDRLPTSHRVGWVDIEGDGNKVLVNAPLAGATAEPPEFRTDNPLVYYRPGEWRRTLIATTPGVVHGFLVSDWSGRGRESVLTAGFAGVFVDELEQGSWRRSRIVAGDPAAWPQSGASEIAELDLNGQKLLATIEPWHGNKVVVYQRRRDGWARSVIDESAGLGHAVVPVDLDGDGTEELVVADRGDERRGVYIYTARDPQGLSWDKEVLDGSMQASSCAAADLSGDGRPDLVCIGRATEELRWYENLGD